MQNAFLLWEDKIRRLRPEIENERLSPKRIVTVLIYAYVGNHASCKNVFPYCHSVLSHSVCVTHSNATIQAAVQAGMHMYAALPEDEAKLPGNLCARTAH